MKLLVIFLGVIIGPAILSGWLFGSIILLHIPSLLPFLAIYLCVRLYSHRISVSELRQGIKTRRVEEALFGWFAADYRKRVKESFFDSPTIYWFYFFVGFHVIFWLLLIVSFGFETEVRGFYGFSEPFFLVVQDLFPGFESKFELWSRFNAPEVAAFNFLITVITITYTLGSLFLYWWGCHRLYHRNREKMDDWFRQHSVLAPEARKRGGVTLSTLFRMKGILFLIVSVFAMGVLAIALLYSVFYGSSEGQYGFFLGVGRHHLQAMVCVSFFVHTAAGQAVFFFFGGGVAAIHSVFFVQYPLLKKAGERISG